MTPVHPVIILLLILLVFYFFCLIIYLCLCSALLFTLFGTISSCVDPKVVVVVVHVVLTPFFLISSLLLIACCIPINSYHHSSALSLSLFPLFFVPHFLYFLYFCQSQKNYFPTNYCVLSSISPLLLVFFCFFIYSHSIQFFLSQFYSYSHFLLDYDCPVTLCPCCVYQQLESSLSSFLFLFPPHSFNVASKSIIVHKCFV